MSFSAAVMISLAIFLAPAPGAASKDPAFQVSPCKPGYEWNEKKKKCVRKGLDY